MRYYIIIRKVDGGLLEFVANKAGYIRHENYNDALEVAKQDHKRFVDFAKAIKAEPTKVGYTILPLDEVGTITFDEVGNIKIGVES